ncbi:hypothetical protein [Lentisalinibacter salinarum]|uniref:hypothetical protein n=1 Tax=Lentisalinibacter salinarum TaxID=2992239 RepID=UPI00386D5B31
MRIVVIGATFVLFAFLLLASKPLGRELALWWYGRDFQAQAKEALADLEVGSQYCIFDDQQRLIVDSVEDLDVTGMITRAFDDNFPSLPSMESAPRYPHFRVYARGRTYWWSFRDGKLQLVSRDKWPLVRDLRAMCRDYMQHRRLYEDWYAQGSGRVVGKSNFCCDLIDPD